MKKILPLFILALSIQLTYSQNKDPRAAQFDYVPGKIIVKLKDDVQAKVQYNSKGVGTTQLDIGKLLGIETKVSTSKVLFSEQSVQKSVARKSAKKKDSRVPNPHTLKNTFLLELNNKEENILQLVEELSKRSDVEYAEPDYNYSVNDFTINSEIIYPENTIKNENSNTVLVTPDDPLYAQQTNITLTNIDKVWDTYTTGDGSQIIAILDTGIDYNHPDLAANIWINQAELNGVEGFDDDGNGYIDDIRGWDFINLDNAPLDDNMHGTHVAGIAGAVGGNGIGIAGAVWNVKLMPIKVFQSNGVGNVSNITKGVEYAIENGATIQNMSFSYYVESITLRNVLENAYATSVLVAAAGNDGTSIDDGARYPAAYTFVIGVQDRADYSNIDNDGPVFSGYSNILNYEVYAPGSAIMSTVPNGGYRALTGTSMSSPLVAGGLALYLEQKPQDSKELLFGNLINGSATYVDMLAALEIIAIPKLAVMSTIKRDTIYSQNGNGFWEPGETIEILPAIKNYWGPTEDVRVGIEFAEFEDQTKAVIVQNEIHIGSISEYAILQDLFESFKITIASNVSNNVNIKFVLSSWSGPDKEYISDPVEILLNVKNSTLLYGLFTEDLTLYPDTEYLVSGNFVMDTNTTLTILPGTELYISDGVKIWVKGNLNALGTYDNRIKFLAENNSHSGFDLTSTGLFKNWVFKYCEFLPAVSGQYYLNMGYPVSGYLTIENCIFNESGGDIAVLSPGVTNYSTIFKTNFENVNFWSSGSTNMISNSNITACFNASIMWEFNKELPDGIGFVDNNIFNNTSLYAPPSNGESPFTQLVALSVQPGTSNAYLEPLYYGSSNQVIIDHNILDYFDNNQLNLAYYDNYLIQPDEEAHGIVWKVLVNGKDAQDEYEEMDPIGVGTYQFDVYFNRAMDTNYPPQISYGVREPYNQKIISEVGAWSPDGKIFSVTHEVKIGATDGINRMRVQGARDLDYFDIPVEKYRFNMLVQSAGSASAGFMATPGLGEITLDWEAPATEELEDVLGYEMYRYQAITDTTFTAASKINEELITIPKFVDFNVEEGTKYFYQYKILRTNFEETDFSKTVTTQPLTSVLGDSNGDFGVNVMDLVQDVDYILGNNPTPFILKAADVNIDTHINVLDIVGTVDIILNPTPGKIATKGSQSITYIDNSPIGEALFYWEENDLYVESKEAIAGIQLAFAKDFKYTISETLPKFEWLNYEQDNQQITMLYSFSNISIPAGKTKLLSKTSENEVSFDIDKAVVAAPKGLKINAKYEDRMMAEIEAPIQEDQAEMFVMGPNPTAGEISIYYYLPELMDKVQISAYNVRGARVWSNDTFKNTQGRENTTIDLSSLSNGVYFLVVDVLRGGEVKKREVKQIILNK